MPGRKSHKPRTFEIVMDEAGEDAFPWDLDEHLNGCLAAFQIEPSYPAAVFFALEALWGIARDVGLRAKTDTLDPPFEFRCRFAAAEALPCPSDRNVALIKFLGGLLDEIFHADLLLGRPSVLNLRPNPTGDGVII